MSNTAYNGWTNYATWRVNLEIFDGLDPRESFEYAYDKNGWTEDLERSLKEFAEMLIEDSTQEGIARSYALAFLNDVNWSEIADHMIACFED